MQPENISEMIELKNNLQSETITEFTEQDTIETIDLKYKSNEPLIQSLASEHKIALHRHIHPVHTLFSEWLFHFLLHRDFTPDGRMLFRYLMNENEYAQLCTLFCTDNRVMHPNSIRYQEWCACYCLVASEIYRREYSGGSWSWDLIDHTLKVSFKQPNDRYAIIEQGMKYWKREIQKRESNGNHQYLGTLFAECGLPVQLLTAENNKFSRLIAHGLAKYA